MNALRLISQEQEKPQKKRNIRKIPGRFTALDSSDEEEDQRQFDLKAVRTELFCDSSVILFILRILWKNFIIYLHNTLPYSLSLG
jgi:hypothetical protein